MQEKASNYKFQVKTQSKLEINKRLKTFTQLWTYVREN